MVTRVIVFPPAMIAAECEGAEAGSQVIPVKCPPLGDVLDACHLVTWPVLGANTARKNLTLNKISVIVSHPSPLCDCLT